MPAVPPAAGACATRSKGPSYRSPARRHLLRGFAGVWGFQDKACASDARRSRALKGWARSTEATPDVSLSRLVRKHGAAAGVGQPPRLRGTAMGSGASKGAAPKGGKRKKNDPRAQLERLVQGGNVKGVADLLSKKTELTNSALDDKSGTRAIHIACKNGDKDMIRELMKRNCFLNQKDSKGCTALMLAAAAGHDKIVKLIVDSGADVRMKDRNDDTALEYAEKNNRTKVKELLNLYACEYTW